jgi:hypothetical protein
VPDEDPDVIPTQAPVTPNVDHETVSSDDVYTVHLRPLFATVVRLPEEVTSLAIGAPTLIAAEHDKSEPRLVFLKPMTEKKVDSNVVVALRSGRTLSIRVISAGEQGSTDPVDFVVDSSQPRSLRRRRRLPCPRQRRNPTGLKSRSGSVPGHRTPRPS